MSDRSDSLFPIRKHPAKGILLFDGQPMVIFDTVCTQDRKPWLANHEVHRLLKETWLNADEWLVGRYVIMPQHLHFFAWQVGVSVKYENWVRYWKSQFSKAYKHSECVWQAGHWDTRMRSMRTYEEKWLYVKHNPVRHELVEEPDQWPYQGEVYPVYWP
jgi:putative transposase